MIQKYINFLFCLICISLFSQSSGEITYKVVTNRNPKEVLLYSLKFNDSLSLYQYKKISGSGPTTAIQGKSNSIHFSKAQDSIVLKTKGLLHLLRKNITIEEFVLRNLKNKKKLDVYYVQDTNPKMEWKITEEKKIINKLESYKATTSFRGQQYEAWFTYEIPLPLGPWKFSNLPGLILLVEGISIPYRWEISNIKFTDSVVINTSDFLLKNHITPKEYFDIKFANDKAIDEEFFDRINSKMPHSMRPKITSNDEGNKKTMLEYKFD